MKKFTLYLFICIFPLSAFAQSKQGDRWILGYCAACPIPNAHPFGGMTFSFTEGQDPQIDTFDLTNDALSVVANDTAGNLLFYSTGCEVYHRNFELMDNGDGINPGDFCKNPPFGFGNIRSGSIALPIPGQWDKHLFFHLNAQVDDKGYFLIHNLLVTTIDMSANNGMGRVVSKNELVVEDSLIDAMAAVRHGNGRDWWVVVPRGTNREFWTILIGPNGIQEKILRTLPPPYFPFTRTIRATDPPYNLIPVDEYQFEAGGGQINFSPDGRFFCRVSPGGGFIDLYRFDRCVGDFTLIRNFTMSNDPFQGDLGAVVAGITFSPDSKILYFNNGHGLFQFSLEQNGFQTRAPILIENYDGYQEKFFYVNFFQMRNAPDGRIYMGTGNSTRYLHVIENPNELGQACNFRQRGIHLPKYNGWVINYFPNFNLLDDPYGTCDTLGINPYGSSGPPYADFQVVNNPVVDGTVKFFVPTDSPITQVAVYAITGQFLRRVGALSPGITNHTDLSDLPNAGYLLVAQDSEGRTLVTRRVVVAR